MAIDCMLLQVCSRIEYISTLVTNKTQGLCPQYGTHVCVQQCSLPELLLTESTFYKYLSCENVEKLWKWINTLGATCKKAAAH